MLETLACLKKEFWGPLICLKKGNTKRKANKTETKWGWLKKRPNYNYYNMIRRTISSFLHQFIECWSTWGRTEKVKTSVIVLIVPPPPHTKLHSSLPLLQLNSKVGLFLSIALNLHSNVLERVDVFLGELAATLLLALHRPGSLRVGGRVGFLCSCHTPRSAERIIRLSDYQIFRLSDIQIIRLSDNQALRVLGQEGGCANLQEFSLAYKSQIEKAGRRIAKEKS